MRKRSGIKNEKPFKNAFVGCRMHAMMGKKDSVIHHGGESS
jgi:hypothetical protein